MGSWCLSEGLSVESGPRRSPSSVMPCRRTLAAFAWGIVLLCPDGLLSQEASPGGHVFESQIRERWLHGRQRPAFTDFEEWRHRVRIDSVRRDPSRDRTTLFLTLERPGGGAHGTVTVDGRGRVRSTEVELAPVPRKVHGAPGDSARFHRWRLLAPGSDDRISLPESRVWGLVPAFHPRRREPGAQWTDTLDRTTERDGFRQSLEGVRVSTIVGDTAIGGRRHWIVRDSARVRYEERRLSEERTLDTLVRVEREAEGTIVGRYVYDPSLRLFRDRHDTTALSGTAVLRYPDGRTFSTPARFQRFRAIHRVAPDEDAKRRRVPATARYGGMLLLPRNDIEKRLATGDAALRDSLVSEWERSRDPDERARLYGLLTTWGPGSPRFRNRLLQKALAVGDTVRAVTELRDEVPDASRPLKVDALGVLLPFMRDPGRAFAFGLARDPFYENPRQSLLTHPPVVVSDTTGWPCEPEACRALADEWSSAEEARLRELGLVARLTTDPRRWSDTVLARAEAGSAFLRPAARLIRGVGATWPAASEVPLPGRDADWRAWLRWMNGHSRGDRSPDGPALSVRFRPSHATAIRFYEARTGRDVSGELRRKHRVAASDSARLVFGSMALALDAYDPDPSAVAERFRSESSAARSLAEREMRHLFTDRATVTDSATRTELVDRLLATVIVDAETWPALRPESEGRGRTLDGIAGSVANADSVFVLADSLPRGVRDRWRRRANLVTADEWRERPDRRPAVLVVPFSVTRAGPFVRLGLDWTVRRTRRDDERPSGFAGSVTIYLVQTRDGWEVASVQRSIT